VAGGGVIYAEATDALAALADAAGIPVAETQAGRGALRSNHPSSLGAIGATGTAAANRLAREESAAWADEVARLVSAGNRPLPSQAEVIGAVNDAAGDDGIVVCAAGSMPGDLHKLWRARHPKSYHVEYGYSCMGYEIPGAIGIKLAAPERDVFVTVGDGSYLMMPTELVTAVQEGIKVIVVLLQNHGYASIGALAQSLGVQRFGTKYRYRNAESGRLDGGKLPVDLALNAESMGIKVYRAKTLTQLKDALAAAKAGDEPCLVHVDTDLEFESPKGDGWWDVPVAEISTLNFTQDARVRYEKFKADQKPYL
jgi:3D-(3,5/4)-trihydroxycyclohexane-1,2-dione acylhydrolase (decyclizing)